MHLYYINLASQPGRRDAMEQQLRRLGLEGTRIEAVTPADISAEDKARYCDPRRRLALTEPELACNMSHIEALRRVADGPLPYGLVVEDDAVLSSALPGFVAAFEQAQPDIDVLKLDSAFMPLRISPRVTLSVGGVSLRQVWSNCPGSGAYIVSRTAAAIIAESQEARDTQLDLALFNPYFPLARRVCVRLAEPALAAHPEHLFPGRPTGSTLQEGRTSRRDRNLTGVAALKSRWLTFYDREIRIGIPKTYHQLASHAEKRVIPFEPG